MKLNYRILGEGQPFIILHGLFGSADNWQTHAKKLAEYYQVILVDLRNHGHSEWSEDFSYPIMAADVQELVLELDLKKAILLGHSMGGKVAMHYAQQHSERLEKVIIVDMGIKSYPLHHQDILAGLNRIDLTTTTTRGGVEQQLLPFVPIDGTRQFLLKNLYWKEKGQLAWRMNFKVLESKMDDILSAIPNGEVLLPTLFIRGALSNYIIDEDLSDIEDQFPDSYFETIDNAGHWVHAEAPEEFIQTVLGFCLR